jgi:hypothetical protein
MERKKGARQQELESAEHLGTEGSVEGGVSGGGVARFETRLRAPRRRDPRTEGREKQSPP